MDEWLAEFKHWVSEEEEFEAFAQPLCQQFQNWTTEEEDYLKYSDEFLKFRFPHLSFDVRRRIQLFVWRHHRKEFLPFGISEAPSSLKRLLQARYYHCYRGSCSNCGQIRHCHQ